MKRRGLFSFLAAAPVGIAGAAGTAIAAQQKSECPDNAAAITISQTKPESVRPKNHNGLYFREIEVHGSFTMWNGEFYIKKPNGQWRKLS